MFTTLANKRKIEEATSAKDDVAPVYLLEDIWQILRSSGPDTAAGFVEFSNKRLAHKAPVVKQKTLRLIKFLCGKGSSDFKRNISKHAGTVRELTHYRGEPDPFKGDVPNQKVREMAKEALEAMFAPSETPSYAPATSSLQSRIRGFGSSAASDGLSAAPSNSHKSSSSSMMGFGNPRFDAPSTTGSSSNSNRYGGRGGYEAPGESNSRGEGFGSMMQRVGSGALSPKAIMDSITAKGNEFLQGRRGPGILSNDDHTGYSSDEGDRGYDQPQSNGPSITPSSLGPKHSENGSGSAEEARLVNQICTPGGLRAQPTRDDLRVFVEFAGSLSGLGIAHRLEDKLADPSWQAVLRALYALEAIIQQGSTAACGEIAVHFQSDPSALEAAMDSPQASVRQRASQVLRLLGMGRGVAPPATQAASASKTVSTPDLLGDLDPVEPTPALPNPQSAPKAGGDLLGDLMDSAPAPAAHSNGSLFSGLELPAAHSAASSQQPGASSLVDMLGHPQTSAASSGQSTWQQPLEDNLFGGLSVRAGQPSAAAPASNPFPDLMGVAYATSAPHGTATLQHSLDVKQGSSSQGLGANGGLSDMFEGLSTGSGGVGQPPRQPTPVQLASQRAASLEKSDPLSGLGLPQAQRAPMGQGQGLGVMRGSSPGPPVSTFPGGQQAGFMGGMQPGAFPGQQLTPQQMHYMRQMQYMHYMQQMQAMHSRGMAGGFMPQMGAMHQQQQQQQPYENFQTPGQQQQAPAKQPSLGSSGGLGMNFSLDAPTGMGSMHSSSAASSSNLGISQQSDFDFVGDHVNTLRGKK